MRPPEFQQRERAQGTASGHSRASATSSASISLLASLLLLPTYIANVLMFLSVGRIRTYPTRQPNEQGEGPPGPILKMVRPLGTSLQNE